MFDRLKPGQPCSMATLTHARTRLTDSIKEIGQRYVGDSELPLGGYVATLATYTALVVTLTVAAELTGREAPDGLSVKDTVIMSVATHKLSRLLTKDPVTSPIRAPFAAHEGVSGPAELADRPRGHGAEKTIGELVTCPFCAEVWVATTMTAGMVFLPKMTRLVMGTFAAVAGADILQYVHAWLERKAG
jgi:Protein of unknown function (DUF1360)